MKVTMVLEPEGKFITLREFHRFASMLEDVPDVAQVHTTPRRIEVVYEDRTEDEAEGEGDPDDDGVAYTARGLFQKMPSTFGAGNPLADAILGRDGRVVHHTALRRGRMA